MAHALWPQAARAQDSPLEQILARAARLQPLETIIIARHGEIIAERAFNGRALTAPTNIKSASKSIMSALVGIAIERGALKGVDQRVAEVLADDLPRDPDPRLKTITIGHLLTMQAGLRPTSGAHYGRWVASDNWVRSALAQPFVADPGTGMQYSTGSSHLLSAILTKLTGRSTLANARAWFAAVDGFAIHYWQRDPQGIYMGGNQLSMSPRSLLAFGEVYRNKGLAANGKRVLPAAWIEQSWTPRTTSIYTGEGYGYAWFLGEIAGERVPYAWGHGGQMLYIVPKLDLTVVMTSDETQQAAAGASRGNLHRLLGEIIAAMRQ